MMMLIVIIFILLVTFIGEWLKSEDKKLRRIFAVLILANATISAFGGFAIIFITAGLSISGKDFMLEYFRMGGLLMIIMGIVGYFLIMAEKSIKIKNNF